MKYCYVSYKGKVSKQCKNYLQSIIQTTLFPFFKQDLFYLTGLCGKVKFIFLKYPVIFNYQCIHYICIALMIV